MRTVVASTALLALACNAQTAAGDTAADPIAQLQQQLDAAGNRWVVVFSHNPLTEEALRLLDAHPRAVEVEAPAEAGLFDQPGGGELAGSVRRRGFAMRGGVGGERGHRIAGEARVHGAQRIGGGGAPTGAPPPGPAGLPGAPGVPSSSERPMRSCSRRSGRGAHQFHLPRRAISEGTSSRGSADRGEGFIGWSRS